VQATGRPKTSIYFHVKDIPLPAKKLRAIRAAQGRRIRKYALARKGKSIRPFRSFRKWTPRTVGLVAHLIFDGEIYRGASYFNRSTSLLARVESLMCDLYDFEPKRYTDPVTGVRRISYHNVALGAYLQRRAAHLMREARRLPVPCKKAFLQAFFDDEGCMDYRPQENRRRIRGYQKNVNILVTVRWLLGDLGIESRVIHPNEVVIAGKENLSRFEKEINFSKGVYMNGNRANSRWKKHVEKRELLRMAIASYRT
jgi:hypothetical protein